MKGLYLLLFASALAVGQFATHDSLTIPTDELTIGTQWTSVCVLNEATDKCAFILHVPKSGNIAKLVFNTGSVTVANTLTVGIYTVSTTNGDPTATAYKGMAVGTVTPTATTQHVVALGTAATAVVAGDVVAVVIAFESWTNGNLQIRKGTISTYGFPYSDVYDETGVAWTKSSSFPVTAFEYDDGTYPYIPGVAAFKMTLQGAFNSGTTPDEVALYFCLPFPAQVRGFALLANPAPGADFDVILYNAASTVLATKSFDGDVSTTGSSGGLQIKSSFNSPVTIAANTWYYLALKPTTTTSVRYQYLTCASTAMMAAVAGGANFQLATRTDGGGWTPSTTQRPLFSIIVDRIPQGSGGGFVVTN